MLAKKAETGWSLGVGVVPLPASLTYLAISKPGRYSVLKYRNKIKIQWNLLYNSRGIYSTIVKKVTSKYTHLEKGKGSKKRCLWEEMPEADRSLIATLTCMYKFCPVPNKNCSENKPLCVLLGMRSSLEHTSRQKHLRKVPFNFWKLYIWVFCLHLYQACVCLLSSETRKGTWAPGNGRMAMSYHVTTEN